MIISSENVAEIKKLTEEIQYPILHLLDKLEKLQENYFVFSNTKIANNKYDNATLTIYNELLKQNFYTDGIINCPYIENENIVDYLTLIPKL